MDGGGHMLSRILMMVCVCICVCVWVWGIVWMDVACTYARVYLPQMCNINTDAMNNNDITNTGTGPTLMPGESSV